MVSSAQPSITPQPGERYAAFVYRAHGALLPSMPDPDTRNQAVWGAWEAAHGNPLRDRAQEFFPAEQYRHVECVPYFMEHQTKSRDGMALNYDFSKLAEICETNNIRTDTDAYSAIASHHTSDNLKGPRVEPQTVGFAGPYHLGMVGRQQPKWAIFADEHHRLDEAALFDRRRRRSVEVMRFRDGRPSYFDPIATLGADSPRLALPVARYEADNADVERYSYVFPSQPTSAAGSNTFIPTMDKQKYGMDPQGQPQQPTEAPQSQAMGGVDDQTVMAIVNAIRATPEMQWVSEQMQAAVPMPDGGTPQPQQQQPFPGPTPAPAVPQSPLPDAGGYGGGVGRFSFVEDEDVTIEKYQALEADHEALAERYSELADQYSALASSNQDLVAKHATLKAAVVQLERRAVDAERVQRIKDLYQQYPHFVVEDEELEKCLYSAGATMTNDEFEAHIQGVERYAQRSSPVTQMLPGGFAGPSPAAKTKEEQIGQLVVERYTALADKGQFKDYDSIEAEIRAEMGLA